MSVPTEVISGGFAENAIVCPVIRILIQVSLTSYISLQQSRPYHQSKHYKVLVKLSLLFFVNNSKVLPKSVTQPQRVDSLSYSQ